MSRKAKRAGAPMLLQADAGSVFHPSDVLYALEWAALAPGLGGWNVLLDEDGQTRLVSIVPPGAEQPVFYVTRADGEVMLTWMRPQASGSALVEIGRFANLRLALLTLCPLSDELREYANESMEVLYPRSLRLPREMRQS